MSLGSVQSLLSFVSQLRCPILPDEVAVMHDFPGRGCLSFGRARICLVSSLLAVRAKNLDAISRSEVLIWFLVGIYSSPSDDLVGRRIERTDSDEHPSIMHLKHLLLALCLCSFTYGKRSGSRLEPCDPLRTNWIAHKVTAIGRRQHRVAIHHGEAARKRNLQGRSEALDQTSDLVPPGKKSLK